VQNIPSSFFRQMKGFQGSGTYQNKHYQVRYGINRRSPIRGNVQRKQLPVGSMPIFFGIQPNRVKEWSSSGGKVVVFAYEAEKFFLPVVPFRCCDGTHRF